MVVVVVVKRVMLLGKIRIEIGIGTGLVAMEIRVINALLCKYLISA